MKTREIRLVTLIDGKVINEKILMKEEFGLIKEALEE